MKFKYCKQVYVRFKSGTMITVYCDEIKYKQGYYDHLYFLYKGNQICECIFNEVFSLEYYESLFSMETTPIDKYNIVSGDLVDSI